MLAGLLQCHYRKSKWLIDSTENLIVEITSNLCLTASTKVITRSENPVWKERRVILNPCTSNYRNIQTWKIENLNINPEFLKNNPLPSLEDLEFSTNELRSADTDTIQDIDNVYFWGKLINKRNKHNKHCVTSTDNKDGIFLKSCFDDEPLQNFEYSADFTIRLFGTNKCLSVNETDSSLGKCNEHSSLFGRDMQTGQFIELYSGKCLQHTVLTKLLHLGDCGEDQKLRRQNGNSSFITRCYSIQRQNHF
jgi:hypothetical protein